MRKKSYYRNVLTFFWGDSKVEEMTTNEKLLFLYFLTNSHTNLCGIYEITKRQICNETGFELSKINTTMISLQDKYKVITYDEETSEILINNFPKHNWTRSPKYMKGLINCLYEVKSEFLYDKLIQYITPTHYAICNDNMGTLSISYEGTIISNKNEEKSNEKEEDSNENSCNSSKSSIVLLTSSQLDEIAQSLNVNVNTIISIYDDLFANKYKSVLSRNDFESYAKEYLSKGISQSN